MSDTLRLNEYNVHDTLIKLVNEVEETDIAIALSSGIDSMSVLFALLECGKNVSVYSFTLEDRESTDFKVAKRVANELGLPFTPVYLPIDIDILKEDLVRLRDKYDCVKKTDYECTWPFLYLTPLVTQRVLATGMAADGHFVISKNGILNYKDKVKEFRRRYFTNPSRCQIIPRGLIAKSCGIEYFEPYLSEDMINYLYLSTWDECNKPKQKMPIIRAFESEFNKHIKIKPHTNYQLGDSGISEHFMSLLYTDWNLRDYKSVTGIYHSLNKGELPNASRKLI